MGSSVLFSRGWIRIIAKILPMDISRGSTPSEGVSNRFLFDDSRYLDAFSDFSLPESPKTHVEAFCLVRPIYPISPNVPSHK
ncbi:hypothetical protein KC330_g33 [Hortaea werneckii]|nr:hypothetical protein KC330_g33 [Hortaea werneckii]